MRIQIGRVLGENGTYHDSVLHISTVVSVLCFLFQPESSAKDNVIFKHLAEN